VTEKTSQRLGDLLLGANLIDEIQLRVALQEQADNGERLGSALVHLGFIDEAVLAAFLSRQADMPCVNIHGLHIPPDILSLVPQEVAYEHAVIPVRRSGDVLYLAMADPFDKSSIEKVSELTGLTVVPMIAPEFRLKKSLQRFYEPESQRAPVERMSRELSDLVEEMEAENIHTLHDEIKALSRKVDSLNETVEELKELMFFFSQKKS
jgi:type IV pilus assembly protein PilB